MKKKYFLYCFILLCLVPLVLADASSLMGGVWDKIISMGRLDFLGFSDGTIVAAFTRILIGIFLFTVFFGVATTMGGKNGALGFLNRGQAGVVSAILAIICAVFMPTSVLLAVGAGWATAVALILIGGPILGLTYLLWKIPWDGKETRYTILLKLVLCLLMFWILTAMKYHTGKMV